MFLKKLKVKSKLVLLLVFFGLLPSLVILSIFQSRVDELERPYGDAVATAAQDIDIMIDRTLMERYGDVQAFAMNGAAWTAANWGQPNATTNPLLVAMNGYIRNYGIYKLVMLVDLNGNMLAVNTVDADNKPLSTEALYHKNFAQEEWFKAAMGNHFLKGKNGFTGTAVTSPYRDETVASIFQNDGLSLAFSTPVVDHQGKQIGVWVNIAGFDLIENLLIENYKLLTQQGLPRVEMMLLDQTGTVLMQYDPATTKSESYKRDFKTVLSVNSVKLGNKASVAAVVEGKSGVMRARSIRKKIEQFVGYHHSTGIGDYPGLGWSLFVRMPTDAALASITTTENLMFYGAGFTLVLASILGLFLGGLAARPLHKTTASMKELAAGNLDTDIAYTDEQDEFGDVARAVQVFRDNAREVESLKKKHEEIQKQAERDKRESLNKLADSFEQNVGHIVTAVTSESVELQSDAKNLAELADGTNRQAATVAAATEEASASVQTVASAAEELSASIGEINHQISESSRIAQTAVDDVKRTDTTVSTLSDAAAQIGDVVKLIQDIAEQTNLLALNATIEAARAGDAGKGFAVVASEVKSLATQTARATEEISQKIITVQGVSNEAVGAIRNIGTTIAKMNEITGVIAEAINQQTAAAGEISHNVQQASAGTAEVSSSIVNVTHAATESNRAANDVLASAQNLSGHAQNLGIQINTFLQTIRET